MTELQRLKITINDLNNDGRGRGSFQNRAILVSQALPGEYLKMEVDKQTKGSWQGRVVEIMDSDPNRLPHHCDHEFICTGCPLLAAPIELENEFKRGLVYAIANQLDILGRYVDETITAHTTTHTNIDKTTAAQPLTTTNTLGPNQQGNSEADRETKSEAEAPFGYRCYTKQVFSEYTPGTRDPNNRQRAPLYLGSYIAGTHQVANNRNCPVLVKPLQQLLSQLVDLANNNSCLTHAPGHAPQQTGLRYALARYSKESGEMLLTVVTSDQADSHHHVLVAIAEKLKQRIPKLVGVIKEFNQSTGNAFFAGQDDQNSPALLIGQDYIQDTLLGYRHRIGAGSFFQVNPASAEKMFQIATDLAGTGDICYEGFCGVGALTLPLSKNFKAVVAVESTQASTQALDKNAADYKIVNIQTHTGDAKKILPELWGNENNVVDAVVLDPPRKGVGEIIISALIKLKAKRIVILSCQPRSLLRDLPPLLANGYKVETIVPVDQFARTAHIETVTLLVAC